MNLALALASDHWGRCAPNPSVGCVLVDPQGRVQASGVTQGVGGAHAEVAALRNLLDKTQNDQTQNCESDLGALRLEGWTAYVTLEPCSHQGRTGPCADRLIAAGLKRVVVSMIDPNPRVSGQGIARLRQAGVQVDVGLNAEQAREINLGFFTRMEKQRPWIRLKAAASMDGFTALPNGQSQWITSEAARQDGRLWRARAGAVLTGIGTVLADDPQLNVRETPAQWHAVTHPSLTREGLDPQSPHQLLPHPLRVVVDSTLRMPLDAKLLKTPGAVWVVCAQADPVKQAALEQLGVRVLTLPLLTSTPPTSRVDLTALMQALAQAEINELHVEAGAQLNGALIDLGLVDEYLIYLAPKMLGAGRGLWNLSALSVLERAPQLQWSEVQQIGGDLRLLARPVQPAPPVLAYTCAHPGSSNL